MDGIRRGTARSNGIAMERRHFAACWGLSDSHLNSPLKIYKYEGVRTVRNTTKSSAEVNRRCVRTASATVRTPPHRPDAKKWMVTW